MGYREIGGLARWLQIVLYACAAVHFLAAIYLPSNLQQLEEPAAYERATGEQVQVWATDVGASARFEVLFFSLASLLFLWFLYRAYMNLDAFPDARRRWGSRWAVAYWFVPFLCLVRPKQIVNDVWRGSDGSRVPTVFNWWWAFWLLFGAGSGVGSLQSAPMGVDETRRALFMDFGGEVVTAMGAILAAVVVGQIATAQQRRAGLVPQPG